MVSVLGDFLCVYCAIWIVYGQFLVFSSVHHLGACEDLVGIRFGWSLALLQLSFCVLQGLKHAAEKPKDIWGKLFFWSFNWNTLGLGQIHCLLIREALTEAYADILSTFVYENLIIR